MRPDEFDLSQYGVGSALIHTVSQPHSLWVRFEDGWRNPTEESDGAVYDDQWATSCFNHNYADWVLRIDPKPAVELPEVRTLGWLETKYGARVLKTSFVNGPCVEATDGARWNVKEITAFTPAVAVPAEALEELRKGHDGNTWPWCAKTADFLAAVDEANGASDG